MRVDWHKIQTYLAQITIGTHYLKLTIIKMVRVFNLQVCQLAIHAER
jgi:hypothetical protein